MHNRNICEGSSPFADTFPPKVIVMQSFDVVFEWAVLQSKIRCNTGDTGDTFCNSILQDLKHSGDTWNEVAEEIKSIETFW